jgi:outer membrane protein assembly factor BamB
MNLTTLNPAKRCLLVLLGGLLFAAAPVHAEDWPMWRHDAGRSGVTSLKLSDDLSVQWELDLPLPTPAWIEDKRLQFDASYEPVVVGKTMYLPSMQSDSLTAYNTETAAVRWRFHAEGPIRFAPVVRKSKVYFGSDDGYLYCLNAASGKLIWRIAELPSARKVLGNDRLISVWPVRGGPVIKGNQLYFTNGIWPFEGVFLNSIDLDAPSPKLQIKTLENEPAQGYLSFSGNNLVIPCGRKRPLGINPATNKRLRLRAGTKGWDDWHVVSTDRYLFHGTQAQDYTAGRSLGVGLYRPVLGQKVAYGGSPKGDVIRAVSLEPKVREVKSRRGKMVKESYLPKKWDLSRVVLDKALKAKIKGYDAKSVKKPARADLLAADRLYGHLGQNVFALDVSNSAGSPSVVWAQAIKGTPTSMFAADDKLFVVTREGAIYSFAKTSAKAKIIDERKAAPAKAGGKWATVATQMLKQSGDEGYAVVLGVGSGQLIDALIKQSKLRVLVIEPDAAKVASARRQYNGPLYGTRVVVHLGDLQTFSLPPYLANLMTAETAPDFDNRSVQLLFAALRPYGGVASFQLSGAAKTALAKAVTETELSNAKVDTVASLTSLHRVGSLEGSAPWTHEYGDASNTLMSRDKLVRAPLGLLWYGGPSSVRSLYYDRHDWPPSLLVLDGRLMFQGPDTLVAVDVYNGRILWKNKLPKGRSPGRRGNFDHVGYHLIAQHDSLYLTYPDKCLRLDPKTGKILATFTLPNKDEQWGRIKVHKDLLIVPTFKNVKELGSVPSKLTVLDRHTGKVKWTLKAANSFLFVSIGADRLYAFDGHIEKLYNDWKRKGKIPLAKGDKSIVAIDLKTGKQKWAKKTEMTATWLSYSKKHDVVIASNRNGIQAIRGLDGYQMWEKKATGKGFRGHPESLWDKVILWHDRVLDQRGPGLAYDIKTGQNKMDRHPVTGKPIEWQFTKIGHHCNYAIASENLMTFRAASAGFLDLVNGGTSRLEGFRPGCRNSLIPADGVLNAPNFGIGCTCDYSIFTSLALVHVPQAAQWSYTAYKASNDAVDRLGINFGAPGDRRAEGGTVWFDWPARGGPSPTTPIKTTPAKPTRTFAKHASKVSGTNLSWVASSGAEGLESIRLTANKKKGSPKKYTVRFLFVEPEATAKGQRVFDVSVQGKVVFKGLDIFAASGGKMKVITKTLEHVVIDGDLLLEFKASSGKTIISGVEIVAE